jgi:hypothetical protein
VAIVAAAAYALAARAQSAAEAEPDGEPDQISEERTNADGDVG